MKTSCKELKRIARENLTGHYKTPMGAFLMAGLVTFAIELPFSMLLQSEYPTVIQTVIYYIVEILVSLLGVVLSAGVLDIHLNMARHRDYQLSQTFGLVRARPDRYLIEGFLVMAITFVVMVPGIAVSVYASYHPTTFPIILAIALTLLGVCAAVYLALRFSLVYYILLDDDEVTPVGALSRSAELMEGNIWRLFVLYLSFLGYMLLGMLTLGIGMLWIVPYQTQTVTQFYLAVQRESQQKSSFEQYV
jgi:uncharacterized membrane protein